MKGHVRWKAFFTAYFVVIASGEHTPDDVLVRLTGWNLQDECLFHNCHSEAQCVPKTGGFSCVCNPGWKGDGWDCQNINECYEIRNVCGEYGSCVDTVGNFTCSCKPGFVELGKSEAYEYGPERVICQDINECSENGKSLCHPLARCENTLGSFICHCPKGFYGDGISVCADMCRPASPSQRVDCSPDGDATEMICMRRGCCWQPYQSRSDSSSMSGTETDKKDVVPPCYYPLPANVYELTNVQETDDEITGTLACSGQMRGGDGTGGKGERPYHIGPFGSEICPLTIGISFDSTDHLRVRIKDPFHERWQVPDQLFPPQKRPHQVQDRKYVLKYTTYPFGIAVLRAATGELLFNSTPVAGTINGLVYEEQYLEFSSVLEDRPILYGFGEQNAPLKLPAGQAHGVDVYTIFARDQFTPAHRAAGGTGLYGAHPFALQTLRQTGNSHGFFMRNSNSMDVLLTRDSLTFRMIGGIIDFSVFVGPSAKNVVQQYTSVIGVPAMPPVWALGFHLCRWGYDSMDALTAVVEKMWAADVPQDVQWSDIDYMDGFRDFTFDPVKYPEDKMKAMVDMLHGRGQRYVTIVDPGISVQKASEEPYLPYEDGLRMGVFVHDHDGAPVEGSVWPGAVVFPDFGHPNASEYWTDLIASFHRRVPVDGLWLDMNEPSNFCDGACSLRRSGCRAWDGKGAAQGGVRGRWEGACAGGSMEVIGGHEEEEEEAERVRLVYAAWKLRAKGGRRMDPAQPPYIPGGAASLNTRTLPMTARHCWHLPDRRHTRTDPPSAGAGAGECTEVLHYDAHNLYGLTEARVSAAALERVRGGRRGLIISRSTFAGGGAHGGHWLGDNKSTWEDLRASIAGILAFGLFGVPLVGADICGFGGDATRELCIRWTQLGAWYPFSRNHNEIRRRPQDPTAFDSEAAALMRLALRARYRLLPYLYTCFYTAHVQGTPVARPVWMEMKGTAAAGAAAAIDDQFFVGGALIVSPALELGQRRRRAFFPAGAWYELTTGAPLSPPAAGGAAAAAEPGTVDDASEEEALLAGAGGGGDGEGGRWVMLDVPLWHVPVHVRGGHIVPTQRAARTTAEVRRAPVTLLVAPAGDDGRAAGKLYLDDGEGLDTVRRRAYTIVHLSAFTQEGDGGGVGRGGNLTAAPAVMGYDPAADAAIRAPVRYEEVRVFGVPAPPAGAVYAAALNGRALPAAAVQLHAARGVLRIRLDGRVVGLTEEDSDLHQALHAAADAPAGGEGAGAAAGVDGKKAGGVAAAAPAAADAVVSSRGERRLDAAAAAADAGRPAGVMSDAVLDLAAGGSGGGGGGGGGAGPSLMEHFTLQWRLVPPPAGQAGAALPVV